MKTSIMFYLITQLSSYLQIIEHNHLIHRRGNQLGGELKYVELES